MQKPGITKCKSSPDGQRSDRLSVARFKPKVLDQLQQALRSRHYTPGTQSLGRFVAYTTKWMERRCRLELQ